MCREELIIDKKYCLKCFDRDTTPITNKINVCEKCLHPALHLLTTNYDALISRYKKCTIGREQFLLFGLNNLEYLGLYKLYKIYNNKNIVPTLYSTNIDVLRVEDLLVDTIDKVRRIYKKGKECTAKYVENTQSVDAIKK